MNTRKSVLVIDDDFEMRSVLTSFLERKGHQVDVAESVAVAALKIKQQEYDVLLVDIMMPGMSGLEFLNSLKKLPVAVDFIVITGSDSLAHREEANFLGAKGYFVKPFDPESLSALIENIQAKPKQDRPLWIAGPATVKKKTVDSGDQSVSHPGRAVKIRRSRKQLQTAIVKLGQMGLSTSNLEMVINEAVRTIVSCLDVQFCGVFQLLPDGGSLALNWGSGWKPGSIGRQLPLRKTSQEGHTVIFEKPVAVENYHLEERFERELLLSEHHVLSGITVIIPNSGTPFGVLGVYSTIQRKFAQTELHFLQSISNIFSEIHERREIEEALAMSEEKYRNLFEESNDVVFISTPGGELIDINPAGVRLFGYGSKEEIMRINIENELFVSGQERRRYHEIMAGSGYVKDFELMIKTKSGEIVFVQETTTALRDERGNIVAYRGIMRDVTRIRQLQRQLIEANKTEIGPRLVGTLANDLNDVLNQIAASCNLIRHTVAETREIQEQLTYLQKAIAKGALLVDKILDLSKSHPGPVSGNR